MFIQSKINLQFGPASSVEPPRVFFPSNDPASVFALAHGIDRDSDADLVAQPISAPTLKIDTLEDPRWAMKAKLAQIAENWRSKGRA